MGKIIINIDINNEKVITIKNNKTNKELHIDYQSKILNAQDVFNIIAFEQGNHYEIKRTTSNLEDKHVKEYYEDVASLFETIVKDLNNLEVSLEK